MSSQPFYCDTKDLSAEKQVWLLNAVKTGSLTFGQALNHINKGCSKMDSVKSQTSVPQLSNEKILKIMNLVKTGELTVEEAIALAEKEKSSEKDHSKEQNGGSGMLQDTSQHNFSVYKYNRYRWQKRILQLDFGAKIMFNIEKGIIKKQFLFSQIKSCEDGEGLRFAIAFQDRQDYELEAFSIEDKRNIIQLANKIIQNNIYASPVQQGSVFYGTPVKADVLREGMLLMQKGGLASVKWIRYFAQLREGELSLQNNGLSESNIRLESSPHVIHLSDGNVSVNKSHRCESFSLQTRKNNYLFKVPVNALESGPDDAKILRDEWVSAIDKCSRKWQHEYETKPKNNNDELYEAITDDPRPAVISMTKDHGPMSPTSENLSQSLYTPLPSPKNFTSFQLPPYHLPPRQSSSPTFLPTPLSAHRPVIPPPPPTIYELGKTKAIPVPPPPLPSALHLSPACKKTKAFHWDIITTEKIHKSFWEQCDSDRLQIESSRLLDQFGIQETGLQTGSDSSGNTQILLNSKIAHNFNIVLKRFNVRPHQLKDKLFIIREEDGGLTDEQITTLRRYVPTLDDIETYKACTIPPVELHLVDQFMMEMCNIPDLSKKLDLLLTIRELPESMNDLYPLITQKIKACLQLKQSTKFIRILEYILAIGNYLNQNAGKVKITGFRLSSLTKLTQLRGKERRFTLLHALVEQILLHEPDLATFFQELTEFEVDPSASIKGLIAEVDVLKNELEKIHQFMKGFKPKANKVTPETQFYKDLKDVSEKYEADLYQLIKSCNEMKKLYSDQLVMFGEPQDQDSQEFFGWISSFLNDFRKIYEEITK
ncbi:formin-like protein 13 [Protopterus annectens]|uniref:formin-like protein 13 n=1 Tax=Protopterus annectens TaxID=7888 RepID=UPI001CFBCF62|nr:formin-like protein 13 [Protopterus annectens]